MSVGKSYNVSGLQLDKTMGGLTQLSTLSDNPVLLSIQQQAFRKLYPNKDPWEMTKMLQNPAEHPELMREILGGVSKFGGGGMYTKMGMASLGVDPYTVDRLMKGQLTIEPSGKELTNSTQKEVETKYYEASKDFVSGLSRIETFLGKMPEFLSMALGNYFNMISDPAERKKQEDSIENAITKGLRKTYIERSRF